MTDDKVTFNWIVAHKSPGTKWIFYTATEMLPAAQADMDLCAMDESRERIAIFRYQPNWEESRPRYLIDRRDHSEDAIHGLAGLVNSLDSSWF